MGGNTGTIVGAAVGLLVIVMMFLLYIGSRYRKVGPNQALIIYGKGGSRRYRVVVGGGAFIWPLFEQWQTLSLEVMTIDVTTPEVYTEHGVPLTVDGVAQIKIDETENMIRTAAGQFLGKTSMETRNVAQQTLEGHLRAILGTMTVEMIYKQRDEFAQRVQDVAAGDLAGMGMRIVSFTIREIRDSHGYLDALGKTRTAEVKRDALIGEATAEREARAEAANQDMEARSAEARSDALAKGSERDRNIKYSEFVAQEQEAQAKADLSYSIQEAKTKQVVEREQVQVEVINKEMQTEVQVREIERKERELDATIRKPAEAERFKIETIADAERQRRIQEAEGEGAATERIGLGRAAATTAEGMAEANIARAQGLAKAEVEKAQGLAKAEVIRQQGLSEAEAMMKKAEAWQNYNQAAITEKVIEVLPAVAAAVSAPLAQTDRIVMVNTGGSEGVGISRLTGDVANVITQLPPIVEALSGMDFEQMVSKLQGITTSSSTPGVTTPPPSTGSQP